MDQEIPSPMPSSRTRAGHILADLIGRIQRSIDDGTWPAGHKLPTERELEGAFGVARNTVRRGLKQLEDAGKIVRHVGRGSFVAEPAKPPQVAGLLERVIGASPSEVMEVRLLLEPWAASLAATRATVADLATMRDCLANAAASIDVPEFEVWDGKLHEVIIASAKNGLLTSLYEAINAARHQPEWMKLKLRTVTDERRANYQTQHLAIVDALHERDAALAADLIRDHLLEVRGALLGF
jgi:DNA-binding FadR family transcriptional regulator